MNVLICGDIHGNLPALELLLKQEANNYDLFISHGDVVNYGPWSNDCVDLLETLKYKILLYGNHEEYYLDGSYPGENIIAKTFFNFCYPTFNKFNLIKAYNFKAIVGKYDIQHTIFDEYLYPDSNLERLDGNYIIGHSHYQFDRESDAYRLINTGSVGQNRKFIDLIEYVVYNSDTNKLQLKSIEYDPGIVINEMVVRNYPDLCIDYYKNKNRSIEPA